jgi:hypothetical protein
VSCAVSSAIEPDPDGVVIMTLGRGGCKSGSNQTRRRSALRARKGGLARVRVNPNAYGRVPVATNVWAAAVSCSRAGTEALAHHP